MPTPPKLIAGPTPPRAAASPGAAVGSPSATANRSAAPSHAAGSTRDSRLHQLVNLVSSRRSTTAGEPPRAQFKSRGMPSSEPDAAAFAAAAHAQRSDSNYGPAYSAFAQPNSGAVRYGAPGMPGAGGALTALGHGTAALAIGVLGAAAMTTFGFFPLLIGVAAYSYIRRAHHYNLAYGGMNPYQGQGWEQPGAYQGWAQPAAYPGWQPPDPYRMSPQPGPNQGWPQQGWQQPNAGQAWQQRASYPAPMAQRPEPFQDSMWQQPEPYRSQASQPQDGDQGQSWQHAAAVARQQAEAVARQRAAQARPDQAAAQPRPAQTPAQQRPAQMPAQPRVAQPLAPPRPEQAPVQPRPVQPAAPPRAAQDVNQPYPLGTEVPAPHGAAATASSSSAEGERVTTLWDRFSRGTGEPGSIPKEPAATPRHARRLSDGEA